MDVDGAAGGQVQDGLRQDLPVGHDHEDFRPQLAQRRDLWLFADPPWLENADAVRLRHRLHGRGSHAAAPALLPIGLRHEGGHVVSGAKECLERRHREVTRAEEHDAHTLLEISVVGDFS